MFGARSVLSFKDKVDHTLSLLLSNASPPPKGSWGPETRQLSGDQQQVLQPPSGPRATGWEP